MEYKIVRSRRRSVALEIQKDGSLLVRAPLLMGKREIEKFVSGHQEWVQKKLKEREERKKWLPSIIPEMEYQCREKAKNLLPPLIERYGEMLGVQPTRVTVTGAQKRFGSCSSKNTICFSWRLMAYPQAAIEYVVVHELAHILHHNHSKAFYQTIETVLPDYKEREKLLR